MNTRLLMTLRVSVATPQNIGAVPRNGPSRHASEVIAAIGRGETVDLCRRGDRLDAHGRLSIFPVIGGSFDGERLRGKVLARQPLGQ